MKMIATHEGWFSFCPVWIKDPDGECALAAKYKQDWLLWLATAWQEFSVTFIQIFMPDYERGWAMTIRELPTPKEVDV